MENKRLRLDSPKHIRKFCNKLVSNVFFDVEQNYDKVKLLNQLLQTYMKIYEISDLESRINQLELLTIKN